MIVDIKDHLVKGVRSYRRRSLDQITDVVLHHSAVEGTVEDFARYHVNDRGWPAIGYHFVISTDGTVYQCNHIDRVSYHCSGMNTRSIGICLIGNFDKYVPSPYQIRASVQLLESLSTTIGSFRLGYHSHYSATACPGFHLKQLFKIHYRSDDDLWTLKE